jgi:hypothetical protein
VSLSHAVTSDRQLARLLQIGVVLEEMVEASAAHHTAEREQDLDPEVAALLQEAAAESERHRERLAALIDELDADSVAYEEVEALVEAQYAADDAFDDVLYDQLCNEETAYKFYDDLLTALGVDDQTDGDSGVPGATDSDGGVGAATDDVADAAFSVDRDRLVETLREIRDEEAAGVEDVTDLMERRA